MGSDGMYDHGAGNGRWTRKTNATNLVVPVSRRRPAGLYSLLGVEQGASHQTVKRAFNRLALANHPDKVQAQARSAATKKMQQLNLAWHVLGDVERRKKYDAEILKNEVADSTIRVQVHRHRLSRAEKGIAVAVNTARRKRKLELSRAAKKAMVAAPKEKKGKVRKFVCRKESSQASTVEKVGWEIHRRSKKERSKDRRLGKFVASPLSAKV